MTVKEFDEKVNNYESRSKYDRSTGFSHKTMRCSTCIFCEPGVSDEYISYGPSCIAIPEGPNHYCVMIAAEGNDEPDITDSSDCPYYKHIPPLMNYFVGPHKKIDLCIWWLIFAIISLSGFILNLSTLAIPISLELCFIITGISLLIGFMPLILVAICKRSVPMRNSRIRS